MTKELESKFLGVSPLDSQGGPLKEDTNQGIVSLTETFVSHIVLHKWDIEIRLDMGT